MRPEERENARYASGVENPIAAEEQLMFSLLPAVPAGGSLSLLDVGCGVGTIAQELQRRGCRVTGMDFSPVAIEKCRSRGLDARLGDVDKEGLPFPDAVFDVVWAGDVVEHVFDPMNLLHEVNRVLKPEGRFLLTTPNDFNLRARWKIFLTGRSIQSRVYRRLRQCKHHTFFSWDLLAFMLAENGLRVETFRALGTLPFGGGERVLHSLTLGRWCGELFVVRAAKT